ncbi:carbohydrate ABC transporter permease [Pseudonocardia nigra]|uniref:carbohydrate ABC transporter permease n=1 Tax=Pseudonocardia nigra TaxID=1921578 RepID=UPI001C5EE6C6|nr:sugar ABC transporter permease [Pseudonocardia nigra]
MTSASTLVPVRPMTTSERTQRRRRRTGLGLALPAVLVMAGLTIIPIVAVLQRAISGDGRAAFVRLVDSPDFVQVLGNTLVWTVVSVVGALVLGHAAALLMHSKHLRGAGLWRGLFMIPWIIPNVVGATVWKWNFSIDYGLVNHALLQAGILSEPIGWLSDPTVVLYALAIVQVWFTAPFIMLMVSAALTSIPDERLEAARIDGAGGLAVLRHIILPAIRPTTGLSALLMVVWALNSFTIIWVATGGGPAGSSTILPILIYQAF